MFIQLVMFRHFLRNRDTCIQVLPCGDIMNDERNRNCIGEAGQQLYPERTALFHFDQNKWIRCLWFYYKWMSHWDELVTFLIITIIRAYFDQQLVLEFQWFFVEGPKVNETFRTSKQCRNEYSHMISCRWGNICKTKNKNVYVFERYKNSRSHFYLWSWSICRLTDMFLWRILRWKLWAI